MDEREPAGASRTGRADLQAREAGPQRRAASDRKLTVALAVTAGVVTGLALWVSRGSLALTQNGLGGRRVGLLPGLALPLAVAIAITAAGAWRRGSRAFLLPLLALALVLLPWLPFRVPAAFLIWTGPLVTWIWLGVLVALIAVSWPAVPSGARRVAAAVTGRARAPLVVFCASALVYGVSARQLSTLLPGGDEPHYLIIAQSLLTDGDLQVENNYLRGDYKAYFQGTLRPDYLRRGKDGQIYSVHAPGLPAIVAPAFALGGYEGVVAFLVLVSALGGVLLWRTAYDLTGSAEGAWFGWAAGALTAPFFFHAFTVYPDGVGAVLVMAGVRELVKMEMTRSDTVRRPSPDVPASPSLLSFVVYGAALALLPWLHTRFIALAAVIGGCMALRLLHARRYRELAALGALPIVSVMAWLGYFSVIYGRFSPAAPYGHYTQSRLSYILRGLPSLVLDQQFGILPNAPVYGLALAGLGVMYRWRRRLAIEIGVLGLVYLAAITVYWMWWGGVSAPARFAVPVLLMLGLPVALFWSSSGAGGRAAASGALGVSLLITLSLAVIDGGRLAFNARDGFARWLDWASPLVDLPRGLPSFLRADVQTGLVHAAIWIAVMLAGALVVARLGRSRTAGQEPVARASLALSTIGVFALAVMVATSIVWRVSGCAPQTATGSQLSLLRVFDPDTRPVAVQWHPMRLTTPETLVSRLEVGPTTRGQPAADSPLLQLGDLPPGSYRVRLSGPQRAKGELQVIVGRSAWPLETWRLDDEGGRERIVRLPVAVNAVTITGDTAAAAAIRRVALQPVTVVPEHARLTSVRARRAGRYGGLSVFSFDDLVFLEETGFWVTGRSYVRVAMRLDSPQPSARLLLRNGPFANGVLLKRSAWESRLALGPGEERVVDVPLDVRTGAGLVEIRTDTGFRPSEVDKASTDARYLGVRIEVR